ncbi:MAG: 4-hydroxythreonine-4-phosphate dehydrogenase PdxA, partial [Phyllobacterium sp.]
MATRETGIEARAERPVLALAMGDPAGISSELAARILSLADLRSAAHFVVIGDRRILEEGAATAQLALDLDYRTADSFSTAPAERPVIVDHGHLEPAEGTRGDATLAGGA